MSKTYHVAVIGASGVVGQKIIQVLEERNFPVGKLEAFASARSAGKTVQFKGEDITIQELTDEVIKPPIEIAFFAAGGSISEKFIPAAVERGVHVIDNSSFYRMDKSVPLVVPEVNPNSITEESYLIANPNCSTIQSVIPLAPLAKYGIKRVIYNTYQAVSGAGKAGIDDLVNKTTDNFPYQISETVIPQIDDFLEDGYTKEEAKMVNETRKILGLSDLPVTATTVRVPIHTSHAVSINIELEEAFDLETVKEELAAAPGIVIVDNPQAQEYPLQNKAADTDEVYVGRIRRDHSVENGLNLYVVADNLRKGAATNSVQIAEAMIEQGLI